MYGFALVITAIASSLLGIEIGYRIRDIRDQLTVLIKREPEVESSVVTPLPATHTDINATSSIVIPKSPAQLEFEEEERIRNL